MEPALAGAVIDMAPDAILLVEADGTIRASNHRAHEIFGYDPGEITGMNVDDLVPAGVRNLHAAHRAAYRREPRVRTMGSGLDLSAERKDASTFPVEVALGPITLDDGGPGVVAVIRDVTDRSVAQQRIQEIQQMLDASREGVFVFDADSLRFDYVNQGGAEQVGYTPAELRTMTPLDINPTMTEEDFRALIQPLLAGSLQSRTVASRHRHRDGTDLDVECVFQCSPVSRDDGRRTIVVFCRDVTERMATERQLQAAERELHVLEDRERIARDLHDTVIQRLFAAGMTLQMAESRADEPTGDRIRAVVDELDQTIRDIRQAIFRLTVHNLDIASVRRRVVDVIEEAQAALGLAPELAIDGAVETLDERIVEHLLAALREALSNVARHAAARQVQVSLSLVGDETVLAVVDDGVGLAERGEDGHGLANLMARAQELGGLATIEPGEPHGTRVTWRVPNP